MRVGKCSVRTRSVIKKNWNETSAHGGGDVVGLRNVFFIYRPNISWLSQYFWATHETCSFGAVYINCFEQSKRILLSGNHSTYRPWSCGCSYLIFIRLNDRIDCVCLVSFFVSNIKIVFLYSVICVKIYFCIFFVPIIIIHFWMRN